MIFLTGTHRGEDAVRSMFGILLFGLIISKTSSNLRWIATTERVHNSPRVEEHEERPETLEPCLKAPIIQGRRRRNICVAGLGFQ